MKDKLVEIHQYLLNIATYYTKDSNEAKDLVQETMLKAFAKRHLFEAGTNLKHWTSTILRNTFINQYRRNKKMKIISLQDYQFSSNQVQNLGEYNVFEEEIKEVVKKLKPDHQKIIKLRQEGYSYEELAIKLKKPIGTIKSQIHFARKQAREEYKKLIRI